MADADPRPSDSFLAYMLERIAAEAAARKHEALSNRNYFRTGFQNLRALSAEEELVMVKALLRRAIKLAGRLTHKHKLPGSLPAEELDSDRLSDLRRSVERLERANQPKSRGPKRTRNLNSLRGFALVGLARSSSRGRPSDRSYRDDEELLDWLRNEKALQPGKSTAAICDELALKHAREKAQNGSAHKTGDQYRLSASLARKAKAESADFQDRIAKARARFRKRRNRQRVTNTKK